MRLKDKVAIITGGSRGIGYAIAAAYLREGARVVIASRKAEPLTVAAAQLADETGGQVHAIPAHAGQPEALEALVAGTVEHFGGLDILVNNAATNPHFGPLVQAEESQWDKILQVNVKGYFFASKYAAAHMAAHGGGKIVNVASVVAFQPGYMMGVYSVSKAAVVMMTKVLAQELAADNIQVNALAPGFIRTQFSQALWTNDGLLSRLEEQTPAGRMGDPEEIAGGAVFLASQESNFMTGESLIIDGGITLSGM
ncbi:MAG: SDR family NAD(P)-dependent oxidoreductase [Anaerolineales bacterium]